MFKFTTYRFVLTLTLILGYSRLLATPWPYQLGIKSSYTTDTSGKWLRKTSIDSIFYDNNPMTVRQHGWLHLGKGLYSSDSVTLDKYSKYKFDTKGRLIYSENYMLYKKVLTDFGTTETFFFDSAKVIGYQRFWTNDFGNFDMNLLRNYKSTSGLDSLKINVFQDDAQKKRTDSIYYYTKTNLDSIREINIINDTQTIVSVCFDRHSKDTLITRFYQKMWDISGNHYTTFHQISDSAGHLIFEQTQGDYPIHSDNFQGIITYQYNVSGLLAEKREYSGGTLRDSGTLRPALSLIAQYTYDSLGYYKQIFYKPYEKGICKNAHVDDYQYLVKFNDVVEVKTSEHLPDIYPNPFSNSLHIDCPESFSAQIYDLQGRLLLIVPKYGTDINTAILSTGMYVLKISFPSGKVVSKLIARE